MARADLLALTDDGLIQLANAGLVKRAQREVATGLGPGLDEAPDGTIEARFSDGTVTRLSQGRPPAEATCTCPASGLCRHRVALVVAYRASSPAPAASKATWDPGLLDGAAFEARLGTAATAELMRMLADGVTVGLEYGAVPAARLPTTSVRFLVPGEIGYARCDCSAGCECAHVALAIRAFHAAEGATEVRLGATVTRPVAAFAALVDLLLVSLLEHGVVAGRSAHGVALERLRRAAEAGGATQLLLAIGDLDQQLEAYAARDARYDEREVLALITELHARTRVGDAAALGIGQPYETAMGKTRLVSLGAKLEARGTAIVAGVVLADTDTGTTMKLERRYAPADGEGAAFVSTVPRRQIVPGLALAGVGQGQILTSVARRRADGLLALGQGARGRTALMPRDVVLRLPVPLAAADVDTVGRRLAARPITMLRPRDRLGVMHVFDVAAVLGQSWSPGSQVWQAAVALTNDGGTLHLVRTYDRAAPAALDRLAAALDGRFGAVRQVAGLVRSDAGALVCDPWSVSADCLVVPDLTDLDGAAIHIPPASLAPEQSPLEQTQALLAGALHSGRRAFDAGAPVTAKQLKVQLEATGYVATAAQLSAWLDARANRVPSFAAAAVWIAVMAEDPGPSAFAAP